MVVDCRLGSSGPRRGSRFRLDKIRGVAVDVEAHFSSVEPDDGVRLRGCVVHKHFCLLDGVGGG